MSDEIILNLEFDSDEDMQAVLERFKFGSANEFVKYVRAWLQAQQLCIASGAHIKLDLGELDAGNLCQSSETLSRKVITSLQGRSELVSLPLSTDDSAEDHDNWSSQQSFGQSFNQSFNKLYQSAELNSDVDTKIKSEDKSEQSAPLTFTITDLESYLFTGYISYSYRDQYLLPASITKLISQGDLLSRRLLRRLLTTALQYHVVRKRLAAVCDKNLCVQLIRLLAPKQQRSKLIALCNVPMRSVFEMNTNLFTKKKAEGNKDDDGITSQLKVLLALAAALKFSTVKNESGNKIKNKRTKQLQQLSVEQLNIEQLVALFLQKEKTATSAEAIRIISQWLVNDSVQLSSQTSAQISPSASTWLAAIMMPRLHQREYCEYLVEQLDLLALVGLFSRLLSISLVCIRSYLTEELAQINITKGAEPSIKSNFVNMSGIRSGISFEKSLIYKLNQLPILYKKFGQLNEFILKQEYEQNDDSGSLQPGNKQASSTSLQNISEFTVIDLERYLFSGYLSESFSEYLKASSENSVIFTKSLTKLFSQSNSGLSKLLTTALQYQISRERLVGLCDKKLCVKIIKMLAPKIESAELLALCDQQISSVLNKNNSKPQLKVFQALGVLLESLTKTKEIESKPKNKLTKNKTEELSVEKLKIDQLNIGQLVALFLQQEYTATSPEALLRISKWLLSEPTQLASQGSSQLLLQTPSQVATWLSAIMMPRLHQPAYGKYLVEQLNLPNLIGLFSRLLSISSDCIRTYLTVGLEQIFQVKHGAEDSAKVKTGIKRGNKTGTSLIYKLNQLSVLYKKFGQLDELILKQEVATIVDSLSQHSVTKQPGSTSQNNLSEFRITDLENYLFSGYLRDSFSGYLKTSSAKSVLFKQSITKLFSKDSSTLSKLLTTALQYQISRKRLAGLCDKKLCIKIIKMLAPEKDCAGLLTLCDQQMLSELDEKNNKAQLKVLRALTAVFESSAKISAVNSPITSDKNSVTTKETKRNLKNKLTKKQIKQLHIKQLKIEQLVALFLQKEKLASSPEALYRISQWLVNGPVQLASPSQFQSQSQTSTWLAAIIMPRLKQPAYCQYLADQLDLPAVTALFARIFSISVVCVQEYWVEHHHKNLSQKLNQLSVLYKQFGQLDEVILKQDSSNRSIIEVQKNYVNTIKNAFNYFVSDIRQLEAYLNNQHISDDKQGYLAIFRHRHQQSFTKTERTISLLNVRIQQSDILFNKEKQDWRHILEALLNVVDDLKSFFVHSNMRKAESDDINNYMRKAKSLTEQLQDLFDSLTTSCIAANKMRGLTDRSAKNKLVEPVLASLQRLESGPLFFASSAHDLCLHIINADEQIHQQQSLQQKSSQQNNIEPPVSEQIMSPQLQMLNKPKPTNNNKQQGIEVKGAGIVLIWPYLSHVFHQLEWLNEEHEFINGEYAERAVIWLYQLCYGQAETTSADKTIPNKTLANKSIEPFEIFNILVDLPNNAPLNTDIVLTELEQAQISNVFKALAEHWPCVVAEQPKQLQNLYLNRSGQLTELQTGWQLTMQSQLQDALLTTLPWSLNTVLLPWMSHHINVTWSK